MGCTCAGNVQAQTGRRQAASALAPLYLSALLPGETEGKEGSGRAMGSTPRLAVSSGSLLSLASGWLFAGLLQGLQGYSVGVLTVVAAELLPTGSWPCAVSEGLQSCSSATAGSGQQQQALPPQDEVSTSLAALTWEMEQNP